MNQPVEDLREMLLAVTRSLVDQPDKLRIDSVCEDETVAFLVYAHPKPLVRSSAPMAERPALYGLSCRPTQ